MESLYVWLFLFAGVLIASLGMLLLVSERELKKNRREIEQAKSNRKGATVHLHSEAQDSGTGSAAELAATNRELLDKVATLSKRLEESQSALGELQSEHDKLTNAQSEAQQFQETIGSLKTQLEASEIRVHEADSHARELAGCNSALETEIAELTQQLQASQATVVELRAWQERMLGTQSENQKLCAENQQLQLDIGNLKNQLQSNETLLAANASRCAELTDRCSQLQSEDAELKKQLDEVTIKNRDLLEENSSISSKLAASHRTIEEIQTARDGIQSENQQLQGTVRELQREIANLKIQLEMSEGRVNDSSRHAEDMAYRNSQLQTEAAELKQQWESSQKTVAELQVELQRLSGVHSDNQKLEQEIVNLREQLQTSEVQLGDSNRQNQEAADRYARLQGEVTDLQQRLEETQPKLRDLESLQQQLANVESREITHRDRQQHLEAQVAELQRELSIEGGKVQALEATRKQLAEMEQICQDLRGENRRLEEEVSGWQDRFATSEQEDKNRQLQQLDDSPIEPEPLIAKNNGESWLPTSDGDPSQRARSGINTGGDLSQESLESSGTHPVGQIPFETAVAQVDFPINGSSPNSDDLRFGDLETGTDPVTAPAVRMSRRRKWRMASIPAIVILAVAGGGAVGFLGTRYYAAKDTTETREFVSDDESSAPSDADSQTAETRSARDLHGKFKITRPTEVYSGPSENSAPITRIEPGIKINVVGSRGGWLEIRSRHGRPPGFVRQEAAVKIDEN